MGLEDKPGTWKGMKLRNIHTANVYVVEYAYMSHVNLNPVPNTGRHRDHYVWRCDLFWDYRNVRKHFVEAKK